MPRLRFPVAVAILFVGVAVAEAQNPRFAPYPEGRFPARAKDAINAYFDAEDAYKAGNYPRAKQTLAAFWKKYPPGSPVWQQDDLRGLIAETTGAHFGNPPGYSALRMLTDCVNWRVNKKERGKAAPVVWTVVLVGKSVGLEPRNKEELAKGGGVLAEHVLDPRLAADDYRILRDSQWLFIEYVAAMTSGNLAVKVEYLPLPKHTIPVEATSKGVNLAAATGKGIDDLFDQLPVATRRKTDWWFVIHPSHVPSKHPPFARTEFVTGGMGVGPDGRSPCFLVDDAWFTRKPPHLGSGDYADHERRSYLPQWFQHEFYHHLFRTYPEMKLEAKDHQWFDRKSWPADFVGRLEADYYHEALHRRFRTPEAKPRMAVALRYSSPSEEVLKRLALASVVGEYVRIPPENDFHRGTISLEKDQDGRDRLRWTNAAGVSWTLKPDLTNGVLETGPDNPYFKNGGSSKAFTLVLARDGDGDFLPQIQSFTFGRGEYVRQSKK